MQLLNEIMLLAQKHSSSDIHLMNQPNAAQIVFRSGKKLAWTKQISSNDLHKLIDYLKFEANYQYDKDSHFQYLSMGFQGYPLRITMTPDPYPYVVIRIHFLGQTSPLPHVIQQEADDWLAHGGLWLICGEMKTGKTTLYYQILEYCISQFQTVLSIEDPIEINYSRFPQLQFKNAVELEEALTAALRLDIDVIGVGEIRNLDFIKYINNLPLSCLKAICTFHASDLNDLRRRLQSLSLDDYKRLKQASHRMIMTTKNFGTPVVLKSFDINCDDANGLDQSHYLSTIL